jgi:cell division protein FtsQ
MKVRILKNIAIWIFIILYLSMISGFVANRYECMLCKRIDIKIKDNADVGFLSKKDVIKLLDKQGINYLGIALSEINLEKVEKAVYSNQIVDECKAYTGINGSLNVEIAQRVPLVRIIDAKGLGYYIDQKGNVLSLSMRFAAHVLVVNGNINTPFRINTAMNINNLSYKPEEKKLKDIYTLARFISDNKFWNAQIVQVYVNHSDEFELVPRVGPHIILLGDIKNFEEKFEKLEIFYREGLNYVGWNQYITINLKFKDQVVCTKI